jgi:hypothetical protein
MFPECSLNVPWMIQVGNEEYSKVQSVWRRYRQFLPGLDEISSVLCFKPGTLETSALQDAVLEYEIGTFQATLSDWYTRYTLPWQSLNLCLVFEHLSFQP